MAKPLSMKDPYHFRLLETWTAAHMMARYSLETGGSQSPRDAFQNAVFHGSLGPVYFGYCPHPVTVTFRTLIKASPELRLQYRRTAAGWGGSRQSILGGSEIQLKRVSWFRTWRFSSGCVW